MSASTENRYRKSTEAPKNLQRIHEISSNHAPEHCATLNAGFGHSSVPRYSSAYCVRRRGRRRRTHCAACHVPHDGGHGAPPAGPERHMDSHHDGGCGWLLGRQRLPVAQAQSGSGSARRASASARRQSRAGLAWTDRGIRMRVAVPQWTKARIGARTASARGGAREM